VGDPFGEQFGGLHDGAVPWCFVAGPGDFGEQWRVGVLAPSKDSVGRRFVLALALDDLRFGEAIAGAARLITEQLALLYRVFEDAMDADAARTLLSACAPHEDGGHGVAFDLILQPRNSGAWWPYAQEVGAEEIIIGADPPPDLVWRMLTSRNGDRDS
jgi:type VI secretion system ImpM family protein